MFNAFLIALAGGILPALLWLWFFLHEDNHPEPGGRIFLTFLAGMAAVLAVLPIEEAIRTHLTASATTVTTIILWSLAEEVIKYVAAYIVALQTTLTDEPIDFVIYMVTVALGFSAFENALFLLPAIGDSLYLQSIITGNMRFVGATLVHIVSSGLLGTMLAISYYRRKRLQIEYALLGIVGATALHAFFNFFIMGASSTQLFSTFSLVWVSIIILLLIIERARKVKPAHYNQQNANN